MSKLFAPAQIHTLRLENRFVRSATWTGTASDAGAVTESLISRMVASVDGGVGLSVTGHAFVQPEGQASPKQIAVYADRFVDGLKRLTDQVHARSGRVALQLAHAGMYAYDGAAGPRRVVSPLDDATETPVQVLDAAAIRALVDAFVAAGRRARDAEFDAVVIHSAHGYLLSQFLSPYFNRRTDAYGGDIAGRTRVHVEILRGLRETLGADYPILVKMNGRDYVDGGLTVEDAAEAAVLMEQAGCNGIELSGGLLRSVKYSPSRMAVSSEKREAYFKEDAAVVKRKISIPLILVGGIRSLHVAESLVENGIADFIAMSRPLICEPNLIARWQSGDVGPAICRSDNRCFKPGFEGMGIACPHVSEEK